MVEIIVKEEKKVITYDYITKSLDELNNLLKILYKPILGVYSIVIECNDLVEPKFILNNKNKYNHINLKILLSPNKYKKLCLAMPNQIEEVNITLFQYLKEGIQNKNLIIKPNLVSLIYKSINKSKEEIDYVLDKLYEEYGSYVYITEKDLSNVIVLNKIVYPRTVLIDYINLNRYRKENIEKCISTINQDIILGSMIKNIKKLRKDKYKYLSSGIGDKFIKTLNTRNMNLLYYTLMLCVDKNVKDVIVILELYERGLNLNDFLH